MPNQVQGVRQGVGILILPDGTINFDPATAIGVMRLNNLAAYNGYVWPSGDGSPGNRLTTDGTGNLSWGSASGIPWTAKGQLVVGTGLNTDTTLAVGTDTSFLVANSTSASGLSYTSSITTAALLPVGNNTTQRPTAPVVGQIRYNTTDGEFEGYGGSPAQWGPLGGMPTGTTGDKIFFLNSQVVTADYTLPVTPLAKNSVTAGPVTIATGVIVTVPPGQSWAIV